MSKLGGDAEDGEEDMLTGWVLYSLLSKRKVDLW